MLLCMSKSLSFSPLAFVTGSPKPPTMVMISAFLILAFRSVKGKMKSFLLVSFNISCNGS